MLRKTEYPRTQMMQEDASNVGHVDMALFCSGQTYLFEFKVIEDEAESKALKQIKTKRHSEKHIGGIVQLIGVEFSKSERQIAGFEVETEEGETDANVD